MSVSRSALLDGTGARWRRTAAYCAVALAASGLAVVAPAATAAEPPTFGGFNATNATLDAGALEVIDDVPAGKPAQEISPINGATYQLPVLHKPATVLSMQAVNSKSDLKEVHVAKSTDADGQHWLYFASEVAAGQASETVVWEFQKSAPDPATCDYDGTDDALAALCNPWKGRSAGDFLVIFEYTGSVVKLWKRTFTGTAPNLQLGALELLTTPALSDKVAGSATADGVFAEGVINLSALVFPADPTQCVSYAKVLPMTVTSPELDTADIKDVVLDDFPGLEIANCEPLGVAVSGEVQETVGNTWELTKTVATDDSEPSDQVLLEGELGDDLGDATWTVTVDKGDSTSSRAASGDVVLTNDSKLDATLEADGVEVSIGGATVTAECPSLTVPKNGGELTCTWEAAPTGTGTALEATVDATDDAFDSTGSGEATVLDPLTGDETVDLEDASDDGFLEYSEDDIADDFSRDDDQPFSCPTDSSLYTGEGGVHEHVVVNTATMVLSDGEVEESATVTVRCTLPGPLGVEADGAGTFDTAWDLDKSVDVAEHEGDAGGTAGTSTWTVTVERTDSGYAVAGTVTVTNDDDIARTATVGVTLDDGTEVDVECPAGSVAAASTMECTYTAAPEDDAAESATVTVTGDVVAAEPFVVPLVWATTGDDTVELVDERAGIEETLEDGEVFTYTEEFPCPELGPAYQDGSTLVTEEENIATLTGEQTALAEREVVTISCEPPTVFGNPPPSKTPRQLPFVPPAQLPTTGADLLGPLAVGSTLMLLGALLVGAARGRRQEDGV